MSPTTLADLVPHARSLRAHEDGIVGLERSFTWAEVDDRIGALARLLVANGVQPGDRVAVLRPKGHESFEAVHAILRAAAIVVPLDPMAPADAIAPVLEDSGAKGIIGHAATLKRSKVNEHPSIGLILCTGDPDILAIATDATVIEINSLDDVDPEQLPVVSPDDPAYLIYTSGSTGTPKGILHTHASGLAYATASVDRHGMTPEDRVAAMTGLHFDMSTFELYAAPCAGSAVVMMSEPHLRFPASFTERASEQRTTIWYAVTFLLQQILDRGVLSERSWEALRLVMFAGEVFPAAALGELMAALPQATFANIYGPAEVNASNVHDLDSPPGDDESVPIGPALADGELLVVDENENPVPPGTKGVLWVSARTRMREYWNRPDLTESSRRPRDDGPDWYVTGDIVSLDERGVAWFHGRRDHQVKLRGIRVELEGVEATLTNHPSIVHAVAGPWSGEAGTLAATVVVVDGDTLDLRELQRWASKKLPAVALPAQLYFTKHLPLTPSGKIDRKMVRTQMAAPSSEET